MTKFKKILLILITIAALCAALVINSFAFSNVGSNQNYNLPSVDFYLPSTEASIDPIIYARARQFTNLNLTNDVNQYGIMGGDVRNSIRSRWRYVSGSPSYFDMQMGSYNPSANIEFTYGLMPVYSNGQLNVINFDATFADSVTRGLTYSPSETMGIDIYTYPIVEIVMNVYTFNEGGFYSNEYSIRSTSPAYSFGSNYNLLERIPEEDREVAYLDSIMVKIDYSNDTTYDGLAWFVNMRHRSNGFQFYTNVMNPKYIDDSVTRTYRDHLEQVSIQAYNNGYNEGINQAEELLDDGVFGFIIDSVEGFLGAELFPNFSIGLLLTSIIGVCLLIWLLKVFAGG